LYAIKAASEKTKIVNAALNTLRQLLTRKRAQLGDYPPADAAWGDSGLQMRERRVLGDFVPTSYCAKRWPVGSPHPRLSSRSRITRPS
jgi:hypothetical protein